MSKKQYQVCRYVIVILLSALISVAITKEQYYLPIIFVLAAIAAMYYCRRSLKTTDVLADERDYLLAGKAARLSLSIYSFIGTIAIFVLMILSEQRSELFVISQYLAYSICALLLLNAFIFRYLVKKGK